MTATFATMAKHRVEEDDPLKKVSVGAKVSPAVAAGLAEFGRRLRQRSISTHGIGGVSNAIDAILEMAQHLKWFEDADDFADKLLEFRMKPRPK